jgi:hypothetical protein
MCLLLELDLNSAVRTSKPRAEPLSSSFVFATSVGGVSSAI